MRFCFDTSEGWWQQLLDALRARARKDSSGLDMMREDRIPMDLDQDLGTSVGKGLPRHWAQLLGTMIERPTGMTEFTCGLTIATLQTGLTKKRRL